MARITEVEYEKIFSPKTLALLKNKSGESLRQMLGSKDLRTVMIQSQTVLNEIVAAEDGYRDELEMVAALTGGLACTNAFLASKTRYPRSLPKVPNKVPSVND